MVIFGNVQVISCNLRFWEKQENRITTETGSAEIPRSLYFWLKKTTSRAGGSKKL